MILDLKKIKKKYIDIVIVSKKAYKKRVGVIFVGHQQIIILKGGNDEITEYSYSNVFSGWILTNSSQSKSK